MLPSLVAAALFGAAVNSDVEVGCAATPSPSGALHFEAHLGAAGPAIAIDPNGGRFVVAEEDGSHATIDYGPNSGGRIRIFARLGGARLARDYGFLFAPAPGRSAAAALLLLTDGSPPLRFKTPINIRIEDSSTGVARTSALPVAYVSGSWPALHIGPLKTIRIPDGFEVVIPPLTLATCNGILFAR